MIQQLVDDGSDDPLAPVVGADDWVAYHGTSSAYCESIELHGLTSKSLEWNASDCRAVLDLAEELQWYGLSTAIGNLRNFGLEHDLGKSGARHVYLAEFFARAQLFAELPGGEGLQSILVSIGELDEFAIDEQLREDHAARLAAEMREIGFDLDDPDSLSGETNEWRRAKLGAYIRAIELASNPLVLGARLESLRPLEQRLGAVIKNHQPVVYAVRLNPELLKDARYASGMAIEVVQPVPPSQLVAKVVPRHPLADWPPAIRFPHVTSDRLGVIEKWATRIRPEAQRET